MATSWIELRTRAEDFLQLEWRSDFELIVAALGWWFVGSPAQEGGGVAEAVPLHVVVLHFAHAFDAEGLPGQVFARAPAALAAGHARHLLTGVRGPLAPGVILHRILAERCQLRRELLSALHRERRGHTDVMQAAAVVEEAQQQRADANALAVLVPAEPRHHAVRRPRVFDLEHRPLAGLVKAGLGFRDDAVEAGALEALQPVGGDRAIVRHRREVDRWFHLSERFLEEAPASCERFASQVATRERE